MAYDLLNFLKYIFVENVILETESEYYYSTDSLRVKINLYIICQSYRIYSDKTGYK